MAKFLQYHPHISGVDVLEAFKERKASEVRKVLYRLMESHVALYENNVPGLENVAGLDRLPVTGATVYAIPMKIRGGSGAPCRIFAMLPGRGK